MSTAFARGSSRRQSFMGRTQKSTWIESPSVGLRSQRMWRGSVAFLSSDEAAYLTGVVLPVDGGTGL